MGFILDGLDTEAYDRNYSDRELLKRILGYFRPHYKIMLLVAVMLTLNSAAGTGGPILISSAIDILAQKPTTEGILLLAGGILILGVASWFFNLIRQFFAARVLGDVVFKLREDVFTATIGHDLSFFDEHPSGKIVSRVTSDTQDFSQVANLFMNLLSQILLVVILFVWLFNINAFLSLLLLAMSPLAVIIASSFRKVARKVTLNARRVTAKINAQIQESISGIMVAKNFRQEEAIYADFSRNNMQSYHVGLRRGLTLNTIFPVMGLASGFSVALLIYTGGITARQGILSPGNWYLFMQAVGYFWWPMINIASFWSQFQDGLSASERVFALIDAEPRVYQTDSKQIEKIKGEIEFQSIGFAYDHNSDVLNNFSLYVKPGETLALVGHTGAGKSSIARLLARFYEFQAGVLLIDDLDIRQLDLSSYRKQIGLVPQQPFLFSDTVMENIRYGKPDADDKAVYQAAQRISRGDWLADFPDGLETNVGERGANLSMGQRQLVALARVLLKDPAILILDEATASVDPFTETQIQEGLETLMKNRTAIVIAHRLSTVKTADRIIVMDRGQIVEQGTHDSLITDGYHYAELYNSYFRHQSLDYKPWEK